MNNISKVLKVAKTVSSVAKKLPKPKVQVIDKKQKIQEVQNRLDKLNAKRAKEDKEAPPPKENLDEAIVGKFGHHVFGTEQGENFAKEAYKGIKHGVKTTKIKGKTLPEHAEDYIKTKLNIKDKHQVGGEIV